MTSFFIRSIVFAVLATSTSLTILAQDKSTYRSKVEEEINSLLTKYHAVGVAVGVVKDRELVYADGFGLKDKETAEPLTERGLFRIASISKSFSATSVMQLVEQGKLSLDDSVTELIGFEVKNPSHPDVTITLRMLLNHTSSINDSQGYFTLDPINPEKSEASTKCYNKYRPGTQYQYCNLNFNMVGAIIERASGLRFDRYVAENILKPLSLDGGFNTNELDKQRFVSLYEWDAKNTKHNVQPRAYALAEDNYENYQFAYSTPRFSPTGGMKMSAESLARYMNMHLGLGESNGVRVISEESANLMQKVDSDLGNYGLALMSKDKLIDGKRLIGHTGSAYGLYSMMFFSPDEKFGIVVITNGCDGTRLDDNVALLKDVSNVLFKQIVAP